MGSATWPHCLHQEPRCADAGHPRDSRPPPLCGTAGVRRKGPGEPGGAQNKRGERARQDPGAPAPAGGGGGTWAERDRAAGQPGIAPLSGPSLKASFLPCARRRPLGDPGGGAARRPRRPVPSHPPSAATPTKRSAQRAAGLQAHTSRWGGAAGGAGELRRSRLKGPARSSRALRMPDRGAGRDRRAVGAHTRARARWRYDWRPRCGGAALVRVSEPAGSLPARRARAGPLRCAFQKSPEAGRARSALQPVSCFLIRSFGASWANCRPRVQNCGRARARVGCERAYAFVSPALACRWAAPAGGHLTSTHKDLETFLSCPRDRSVFWGADNRPFSLRHRWL